MKKQTPNIELSTAISVSSFSLIRCSMFIFSQDFVGSAPLEPTYVK